MERCETYLVDRIENLLAKLIYSNWISINHMKLATHCVTNNIPIISFNWDSLMDDALFVTQKWNYATGYGVSFKWMYLDGKQERFSSIPSMCVLLKPHGSMNWFKYRSHNSINKNGFTGDSVSDEERGETGLFLFSLSRRNDSEKVKLKLNLGRNLDPLLKMPVETDIIPPGDLRDVKRHAYDQIYKQIAAQIKEIDIVTIIGFGMKDTDAYSKYLFRKARMQNNKKLRVKIVNPCKGKKGQEEAMRKKCEYAFAPCELIFVSSSFRDYCNALLSDEALVSR